MWYLECLLFLGGFVLWAFVFAWHTQYTRRPVFIWKVAPTPFRVATGGGLLVAALLFFFVNPSLRAKLPQEYPVDLQEWLAIMLFNLAFTQLFILFAPLAWLLRLFQGRAIAIPLTVLVGVFVMVVKNYSLPTPLASWLFVGLMAGRATGEVVSIYLYLRGGMLLVWWFAFLVQTRHLLTLAASG